MLGDLCHNCANLREGYETVSAVVSVATLHDGCRVFGRGSVGRRGHEHVDRRAFEPFRRSELVRVQQLGGLDPARGEQ
jgi:hypothetical protein